MSLEAEIIDSLKYIVADMA